MIGKKINQLATELAPASTDLTIIGNPTTGVSKKITLAQLGAIFSGAVSFYTNLAAFPTPGTTDVIYCAKDTQKLYLWSGSAYVEVFPSQALLDTYQLRSEKGNANGYASLDSQGKVPISQLPSSIMEYKGTWNASTNTPTLANGTGDTGDVYICNVAGTVNFGAGAITFAVGDYVIYSGTIWQRSSGAVGTVTSVAASITGDSVTISGSPVTTSGTLAFAFAGTGAQYIKGDGTLATFPTTIDQAKNLITEVYNSTGATLTKGTVVYINGGQGNLPTITKALASGDSTSAQTYGIVQADITNNNNGFVVVAGRLADIDTSAFSVGTQLYLSSTTAGAYTSTKQYAPAHLVYVGIIVRSHPTQGIIEVKIQNGYELDELHNVSAQTPTNNDGLFWEASTSLWKNKSLSTILGGTPVIGSGTQNRITKWSFTTGEIINSSLVDTGGSIYNTLTNPGQFSWQFNGDTGAGLSFGALINAGTNASDIALRIQNASSTSVYFYVWGDGRVQINNIPNATTDTDRFLVSDSGVIKYRTGAELLSDIGGQPSGTYVTSVGLSVPTGFAVSGSPVTSSGTLALAFDTGYSLPTIVKQNNWDTAYNTRIVTASSPLSFISNTISISQASGSANGFLSSTDWTTFNNKQNALTNPVTGTGTTNYLPKFTGTSTIGNSLVFDNGTNVGIGTATPNELLSLNATGNVNIHLTNATSGTTTNDGFKIGFNTSLNAYLLNKEAGSILFYTTDTLRATLNASGNLGLGVTPSAWGTDFTRNVLQFGGSVAGVGALWTNRFNNGVFLGNNVYDDGVGNNRYILNGTASIYVQASGQHYWQTAPSGTAGNAISFTQAMTLDASGNLGLGTTSPSGYGSGYPTMDLRGSVGSGIKIGNATDVALLYANSTATYLRTSSSKDLILGTFDTARLTIASSGAATFSSSVTATSGILKNSSASPTYLSLDGTNRPSGRNYEIGTGYAGVGNDRFYIYDNTAGASRLVIDASGLVGIGTTSPTSKLHVVGLPTSSSGLTAGAIWIDGTTLKIVT